MANTSNMSSSFFVLIPLLLVCLNLATVCKANRKIHYIHWNKANPMFRLDNTNHIIDVNAGNLPGEYDQVNIICPVSKTDVRMPERHVIYSVSREEFDSCRITNPKPQIVAVCSKPYQLLYFTITFRSFSPTPGGLEFHPGQDYYFISTSSSADLHRRVGGGCSTQNMKMIFKVSNDNVLNSVVPWRPSSTTTTTTKRPLVQFKSEVPSHREYYLYHPRDLIESKYRHKKAKFNQNQQKTRSDNDVWKNEALRYTSSSSTVSLHSFYFGIFAILLSISGLQRRPIL
jgi:ephrin-B